MKTIQLNRNSWHARLIEKSIHQHPQDFCSYVRLVGWIVSTKIVKWLLILLAFGLIFLTFSIGPIWWFVTGEFRIGNFMPWVFSFGLFFAFYVIPLLSKKFRIWKTARQIEKMKEDWKHPENKESEDKTDSFLISWFISVKDKTCFRVNLVE